MRQCRAAASSYSKSSSSLFSAGSSCHPASTSHVSGVGITDHASHALSGDVPNVLPRISDLEDVAGLLHADFARASCVVAKLEGEIGDDKMGLDQKQVAEPRESREQATRSGDKQPHARPLASPDPAMKIDLLWANGVGDAPLAFAQRMSRRRLLPRPCLSCGAEPQPGCGLVGSLHDSAGQTTWRALHTHSSRAHESVAYM